MKTKLLYFLPLFFLLISCYNQERNCANFKTGKFEFVAEINGEKKVSTFVRTENLEIETFEGKTDSAAIRWVNDCEFVLEKLNPKTMADKKPVSIKIVTTNGNECTFEYGYVGDSRRERGTIKKIADL
ncbi:DNA topoisomerase IV [Myroides marinus]|uniref:DNA topoisomerase IV n=1 Tax=Myroides marinus TaxID=703342 RepID=UPI002577972B|nr:DNA topoisomerase IV [Myroides marinus]MDM1348391.1 DNA topoisomerase IV [Myroides marinus]MDM1351927.1 DNA topoisomerase IV [Myroides marinus]MDM1353554.1 DNA topoisomerase IV [Myroides marinus]MDM1359110.1 DNA topoisomerase IV [Myroides marinus]MDM1366244.1 DNA topoisomerase IV [Myroides marinus]